MYHMSWFINIKILITIASLDGTLCTIDGIISYRRPNATKLGGDPCNPLYWYPRTIPEYCNYKRDEPIKPPKSKFPHIVPMPIPVPLPPVPPALLPPIMPHPMMSLPYSLPFGIPLAPTNPMLPIAASPFQQFQHLPMYAPAPVPPLIPPPPLVSPFASYVPPYGIHRRPMSMVPGLPGLVSPDGGINVLPFSDAYANLLERHKQKMIRKRLQKLLDEYDSYPWKGFYEDTRRMSTGRQNVNKIMNVDEMKQMEQDNSIEITDDNDYAHKKDQGSDQMTHMEDMFKKYDFLHEQNHLTS